MMAQKLYAWAKKIHRWFVILMLFGTAGVAGTGMLLGNPQWMLALGVNPLAIRFFHAQLGPLFVAVLSVMALTGTYLYLYPSWMKRQKKNSSGPTVGSPSPADGPSR